MNKLFPAIAAFVVVGCGATIAQKPDEKQLNEELRTELRKRVKEDQDARQKFIEWLKTRGTIDPKKAAEGTIRKMHAQSIGENSVHGSDAPNTAAQEIAQFFSGNEIVR